MRKNTIRVFNAWAVGKEDKKERRNSIWCSRNTIYSYNTPIVFIGDDGKIVLNTRKYSKTTSNHQNSLRFLLHLHYRDNYVLDNGDPWRLVVGDNT